MKSYFKHRRLFRIIFGFSFLFIILLMNIYVYKSQNKDTSFFFLLLVPLINLINEFSPDIYALFTKNNSWSNYKRFRDNIISKFQIFIQEYFNYDIDHEINLPKKLLLFPSLESIIDNTPDRFWGSALTDDKRRKPIVVLLFLIKFKDKLNIDEYENVISYIKSGYRNLTDKGKKEFIFAYKQLVQQNKCYLNVDEYFQTVDEKEIERVRLSFYDQYSKDDYLKEIFQILKLKDKTINSFKKSLETVSKSSGMNLDYLKRFINKRKKYRKLYVVTSAKRLPKTIQSFITQRPHFILNYSSIANLPKIGLSNRFDIFFFSPNTIFQSSKSLYNEFRKIDSRVENHPIKIYEVDPTDSHSSSLEQNAEFLQAIHFFEDTTFNSTVFHDLKLDQILVLLEHNKISLKDVISELPIAEFSDIILLKEKEFINDIMKEFLEVEGNINVFNIIGKINTVKSKINHLSNIPIEYDIDDSLNLFSGNITKTKVKSRLKNISKEICDNIKILSELL